MLANAKLARSGIALAMFFVCASCGMPASVMPLDEATEAIEVRRAFPPPGSRALGLVKASHGGGCGGYGRAGTHDGVVAALKGATAKRGGNYVFVTEDLEPHMAGECWDWTWTMRGRAYLVRRH